MLLLLVLTACSEPESVSASVSVAEAMTGDTTGYARATTPREFVFPQDHGPHPAFKTEWWYVTGTLAAASDPARRFGLQFTIFRSALSPDTTADVRASDWAANQMYMAHVALTDVAGGAFHASETFARGAAGLAGAEAEPLRVWLGNIELEAAEGDRPGGAVPMRLTAETESGAAYDLVMRPLKPPVLQGERGLSQKGPQPGNASYYYSQTRMAAEGTVTLPGGETVPVEGTTWMDREWSTSALGDNQVGWDWFALHFEDGRDLMIYQLRRTGGTPDPLSKATLVAPDGSSRSLANDRFTLTPLETWASPEGGAYPVRWQVKIPSENIDLTVVAMMEDQELDVSIRYWEGAVSVSGTATGRGYLEMTGYADAASPAPGDG